jgi:tRNA threonylcarbamoyladenosine biosynthesis protein TsaB
MPMRILAVDTSSQTCSVAVLSDGNAADISFTSSRTHSRHLMDMIDYALGLAGVRANRLDAVAVTRGPGTFTGLRIGISAAKAIAMAGGKPLVGISGLEALAVQTADADRLICPMVDARRGEVYYAFYRSEGGRLQRVSEEKACAPMKVLEGIRGPCRFVGNGAELYRDLIVEARGESGTIGAPVQNVIRAATLACMAGERLRNGDGVDPGDITPLYLRKSDAELKLGKKVRWPAIGAKH